MNFLISSKETMAPEVYARHIEKHDLRAVRSEHERKRRAAYWMNCLCMGSDKLIELAETCDTAKRAAVKLNYMSA
jgi:hypothetical protein